MATAMSTTPSLEARAAALQALHRSGLDAAALVTLDLAGVPDLAQVGAAGYHVITRSGARVPISAATYTRLVELLCRTHRLGEPGDAPLFLSRLGHRLSTKQARRILQASVA